MSDNTYGSYFLHSRNHFYRRKYGDNDLYGKNIKNQTLLENLKRYWKNYHHENKRYFWWLGILMLRLERSIRIKWRKSCQTLKFF